MDEKSKPLNNSSPPDPSRSPRNDAAGMILVGGACLLLLISITARVFREGDPAPRSPREQLREDHPNLERKLEPWLDASRADNQEKINRQLDGRPRLASRVNWWVGFDGVIFFAGLLAVGWWIFVRWWTGRDPLAGKPFGSRPWNLWGVAQALSVVLYALVAAGILLLADAKPDQWSAGRLRLAAYYLQVLWFILAAGGIWWLMSARFGAGPRDFGLRREGLGRAIWYGIVAFSVLRPVEALLRPVTVTLLGIDPDVHPIVADFILADETELRVTMILFAVVIAPLMEEYFFRGIVQAGLRRHIGPGLAIACTALLFSLLHGNVVDRPTLFAMSLLLGYIYERTGNLAAPVTMHALNNGASMIYLVLIRAAVVG